MLNESVRPSLEEHLVAQIQTQGIRIAPINKTKTGTQTNTYSLVCSLYFICNGRARSVRAFSDVN